MNIFHFYTKEPNSKSKSEGMVVAMDARTAALNAATKLHDSLPEGNEHTFSIWVRMDEAEEIYAFDLHGKHVVHWNAEPRPANAD